MAKILMNKIECKIKSLISEKLSIFKIEIIDDSHKHANHKKDTSGGHFRLFIVSNNFKGLNLIKRHQLIYEILKSMIKTEIHALSMKLLDIEEYNNN